MKKLIFPPTCILTGLTAVDASGATKALPPQQYNFKTFLREMIWRDERWLSDSEWTSAYARVTAAIEKGTAEARLTDSDHEKLVMVARGAFPKVSPGFTLEFQPFFLAIMRAEVIDELQDVAVS